MVQRELSGAEKAAIAERVGYRSWDRFASRAEFLFDRIPLQDRRVLDVGCGLGAFAIWAGLHGAHAVGLEPEAAGSTESTFSKFRETVTHFGLDDLVQCVPSYLEAWLEAGKSPVDVLVLFNVINHLDEEAVQRAHQDTDAQERFIRRFETLRAALRPGGWLIVADCARANLWNHLGLRSPVVPTIEWHKHQSPGVWRQMAESAGFQLADLRWSYLYPFRRSTGNFLVQYLTASHFVLRLRAS